MIFDDVSLNDDKSWKFKFWYQFLLNPNNQDF